MTNPPATADYDAFTVTRTIRVRAPRTTVWAALTDPAHIAQWFGQRADFPGGVHKGAEGTFGWDALGDAHIPVRIDRFEPEDAFDFTWGKPGEELRIDNSTTAHFALSDDTDSDEHATVVTVTETGFENLGDAAISRAEMDDNRGGWTSELDEFVAYTEALVTA